MALKVSVIVCTYNRINLLTNCIKRLAAQTMVSDQDFEVLIVDNKSTDDTAEVVQQIISERSLINFHYFLEENQGHSYARNRGIAEASGNVIAYLDDDAYVRDNYVVEIQKFFDFHSHAAVVGGRIIPVYESQEPKWMSKYLLPLVAALDMGEKPKKFKGNKFPIGANVIFRKRVFEEYGLFNVELGRIGTGLMGGDEKDLAYRLKDAEEEIWYSPDIVVDHFIPDKRLGKEYIRGLAEGVGRSEKIRLRDKGLSLKIRRIFEEAIKVAGTVVLFVFHSVVGNVQSAWMLVKFRFWVIRGFLS